MNREGMGLLLGITLAMAGCGEVTVTVPYDETTVYAPAITTLRYNQDTFNLLVDGSIDFADLDGDLATLSLVVIDRSGREVTRISCDLAGYTGAITGTIPFSIDYISLSPGRYTFSVSLSDQFGNQSNPAYGDFVVP